MDIADEKLAAARLLLGDDLARRLIDDQWNAVNDLSDPHDVADFTMRASLSSAKLAAEALGALMAAMREPALDLADRRQKAFSAIAPAELASWFETGEEPAAYAAEVCAPFEDPEPTEIFEAITAHNTHLQALLDERFSDVRLVRFEGGQLDMRGSIVHTMAECLAQTLGLREDMPLANYVEVRMDHPEIGELILSIQRASGKTPHELRREAEEELVLWKSGA